MTKEPDFVPLDADRLPAAVPREWTRCFGEKELFSRATAAVLGDREVSLVERIEVVQLRPLMLPTDRPEEFTLNFYNRATDSLMGNVEIANEVKKRYGDRAVAFRRCIYANGKRTYNDRGWFYLSGRVKTRDEVFAENNPDEDILRSNIRLNDIPAVIVVKSHTFPFYKDDDVIDETDDV